MQRRNLVKYKNLHEDKKSKTDYIFYEATHFFSLHSLKVAAALLSAGY